MSIDFKSLTVVPHDFMDVEEEFDLPKSMNECEEKSEKTKKDVGTTEVTLDAEFKGLTILPKHTKNNITKQKINSDSLVLF